MLFDDTRNRRGADSINPGEDAQASGQGVSNSSGKTRGGIRDIYNKYSKQYRDGKANEEEPKTWRGALADQAKKKAFAKGKDYLANTETGKKVSAKGKELFDKLDSKTGGLAGKLNRAGFTPTADREELKKQARDYMKKEGKEEIKNYLNNRFKGEVKQGVKEGVEKGTKSVVKAGVKEGTEQVVKQGVKIGTDAVVEGGIEVLVEGAGAAGFAGGPLGLLTELLAQLIVIAISLGISDAIDGTIELAKGHPKQALHYFIRAATKILVFVLFLLGALICGTIIPTIGLAIPLVAVNVYWAAGSIPFVKELAIMQGLVWWEKIAIVIMDFIVIEASILAIFVGLYLYCNPAAAVGSAVGGPLGGVIGGVIDSATTSSDSFCNAFNNPGGGGGDFGGGGAGGSVGSVSGDETVGTFTPPGGSCKFSGVNLCQGKLAGNCTNASVIAKVNGWSTQVDAAVSRYGPIPGVANTSAFIKAIMTNESGGDQNAQSGTGAAGLMQFLVGTANSYGPQCSSNYQGSIAWLKAHPEESICMSIKYFQSMAKGDCGKPRVEVRNLAAGYNRGPGYCQTSGRYNHCSGETGCDGSPVKGWECLWDDAGHSQCSTYVIEGQKYAPMVFACYVKFNSGGN